MSNCQGCELHQDGTFCAVLTISSIVSCGTCCHARLQRHSFLAGHGYTDCRGGVDDERTQLGPPPPEHWQIADRHRVTHRRQIDLSDNPEELILSSDCFFIETDMNRDEQLAHLRLIRTPNIGPMTFSLLIQRYGNAVEALRAVPDLARRGGRDLKPASKSAVEKELAAVEAAGATLLFKGGDGYPDRLARFDDAPPVISARGSTSLMSSPSVAIVGARNASINAGFCYIIMM